MLLWGLSFVAIGMAAFESGVALRGSPDSPDRMADLFARGMALSGLILVLTGSTAIFAASVAFSSRMTPEKLSLIALAFLSAAGVISGISHMFVITTYAWMPLILPWLAAVVSGLVLLLVATFRFVVKRIRS